MTAAILRGLATLAALALLVFALVAYRTAQRGALELAASDRAFDAGQLDASVQHARRAATAFVPGAPHVARAYERLRAIARGAERQRDPELSRFAWRSMVAAATESRHLWQPHSSELREARAELERSSAQPLPASAAPEAVSLHRALSLLAGAALFLLGLWRSIGGAAGPGASARLAALACVAGLVCWGLALLGA